MKRELIISIIGALLIVMWTYASLSKLVEFSAFTAQLEKQPLPDWSIPILRWTLPVVELMTAWFISRKRILHFGIIMSTLLITAFTGYVILALSGSFGNIPCSCAGIISQLHWKGHLVFNVFFLVIGLIGILLSNHQARPDKHKNITVTV